jgi:Xaa-Pro aminopeptidase
LTTARPDAAPSYTDRLARLRAAFPDHGIDALLVTHPPNLRYLTGFDGSMGALLVLRDSCALLVDGRYATAARDRVASTRGLDATGVVLVSGSYEAAIGRALAAAGCQRAGIEAAVMTVSRLNRIAAELDRSVAEAGAGRRSSLISTEGLVEDARLVKDEVEIGTLRTAARMLSEVARQVLPRVQLGRTELDIAAEVDDMLRRAGFERPAFDTIVASGPNSALPHARPGRRELGPGDGVLLDFGGVHDGYCVDLTRTVQLPPVADAFMRLYDAVRAAHRAALAAAAPGVTAGAVDTAARRVLEQHGLGEAFLHGTGHGLGLEIHERPRLGRADTMAVDEVLVAGMVFTVEPGAYLAGIGGVRLEDDVLLVEGGCEVLTDVPLDPSAQGLPA